MKLARFGPKGQEKPGLVGPDGRIHDLSGVMSELNGSGTLSSCGWPFSAAGMDRLRRVEPRDLPLVPDTARLGCCLADAPNIYGVGLNFSDRLEPVGTAAPEFPIFFSKATSALAGPSDALALPSSLHRADFEVELAVVIGADCYRTPESVALDHVAGYALANDLSERDLQVAPGGQWLSGKSLPGFAPLGPWLLTADEVENPQNFRITASLNGMPMQSASTADMLFSVAELISHLSHRLALRQGDVLLTGTPFGYGLDQSPPRFLRAGDSVILEGGDDAADGSALHSGSLGLGRQITKVVDMNEAADGKTIR